MSKINLPTFLKNTDTISKTASHEQLESFIHEIARTLPETGRNSFLEKFKAIAESPKNKADMYEMDDRIRQELKKEIASTKERLVAMNKGELCLDSEYNEYWDEWYDEDDDNIIFKDPLGLLDVIDKAMRLVHKCIDMRMYDEGFELALFLLLLYKGEELTTGIRKMCTRIMASIQFVESAYSQGTEEVTGFGDVETLWKCFRIWKADKVITDNNRKQWISGIENMLEKRVDGIMSNNRRNYYGECAGFIAALFEVEEAAGLINSRQQILQKYKNAYPRRRAFHKELRDCGMV